MKHLFIFFVFILFSNSLYAQTDTTSQVPEEEKVHTYVDEMPEFPGGPAAMLTFIKKAINPDLLIPIMMEKGVTGRSLAMVQIIVEKDGSFNIAQIGGGLLDSLNKEAERIVNTFPKFTPGKINGEPVRTKYTFPIDFNTLIESNTK